MYLGSWTFSHQEEVSKYKYVASSNYIRSSSWKSRKGIGWWVTEFLEPQSPSKSVHTSASWYNQLSDASKYPPFTRTKFYGMEIVRLQLNKCKISLCSRQNLTFEHPLIFVIEIIDDLFTFIKPLKDFMIVLSNLMRNY